MERVIVYTIEEGKQKENIKRIQQLGNQWGLLELHNNRSGLEGSIQIHPVQAREIERDLDNYHSIEELLQATYKPIGLEDETRREIEEEKAIRKQSSELIRQLLNNTGGKNYAN